MLRSYWINLCLCGAMLAGSPLVSQSAEAADVKVDGAVFPDTLPMANKSLALNGVGVRVFYHLVSGYATGLYVLTPSKDPDTLMKAQNPKVIYTQFLHDASVERIKGEYDSIHEKYCKLRSCDAKNEASYATFTSHLVAAKKGDAELILITDQGVSLQRKGVVVVSIDDPKFGIGLIDSLVGPASPTEKFRDGVLGLSR